MNRLLAVLALLLSISSVFLFGQAANGKLQIHFMDVGQGDGAILISPLGESVLFDNGPKNDCDRPKSYLQQLGLHTIDYQIASHYHADHIGCTAQVLTEFPLQKLAFDRGTGIQADVDFNTQNTYLSYVAAVGVQRRTATAGTQIKLDASSTTPVIIDIVSLNGTGGPALNENDLSVVAVVRFASFKAVMAGDLSGEDTPRYHDIETTVGPKVGPVDVYKVDHHGSDHSSNVAWLANIKPTVGIISAGDGNTFGHPREATLHRLHDANVKTYWTEEGTGVRPQQGLDVVGGNITVEVGAAAQSFTVTHSGTQVDTYPILAAAVGIPAGTGNLQPRFAWSTRSDIYHKIECRYVSNISPANLAKGINPPAGKRLHAGCPR